MPKFKNLIKLLLVCLGLNYLSNNLISKTYLEIKSDKITKNCRIVQISDTHEKTFPIDNEYLLYSIRKENPDIIVHTGDFTTRSEDYVSSIVLLRQLSQIAPVFIVQGNHDVWCWDHLASDARKIKNVYILNNESVVLDNNIKITGFLDNYKENKTFIKTFKSEEYFNLCLIHKEEFFKKLNCKDFDYFLSGHTHGGQWRIPFVGALTSPKRDLFPGYIYGEKYVNETPGYVNRGLGGPQYIPRINNHPEITVLDIKSDCSRRLKSRGSGNRLASYIKLISSVFQDFLESRFRQKQLL